LPEIKLKDTHLSATPLRNCLGLSSFEMPAMFRRGLFYAYLSIYLRHHLGLSVTETTLFATLPMVVNVLAQTLVWGKLSDRLQMRRTLIIIGEVLAAGGTVAVRYVHRHFSDPQAAGYAIADAWAAVRLVQRYFFSKKRGGSNLEL
jgi:MFS family permease